MEHEIDRQIGAASAVMRALNRSVVVKKELSRKAKLLIYRSIYVPVLTYGHQQVFWTCPTGRLPRGRPRTKWRDYISRLAWERLGVPPEEGCLGIISCCSRDPDPDKREKTERNGA
ncbi:hypothetical protein D4764_16G0000310 [Takifugu flavidus]|uniref:Uncharacterized protein n=1 Tax=Takifugu flavidus TaxID=433684 RepID=A0A5C6NVJ3_9TELE|nr:hypothetical protein D4764_16G0000310 [Takifugu flavidus]